MSAEEALDANALQQDDLVIFNHWMLTARLGSVLALLLLAAFFSGVVGAKIPLVPVGVVAALHLAVFLGYRFWLRTRQSLRLLAHVQVFGDVAALLAVLSWIESASVMLHLLFVLAIVPAAMIGWQCTVGVAAFATAGHFLLLWQHGAAAPLSMDGVLPPALFMAVGAQSLFYARHVAEKNWELEAGAETLGHLNQRLEEEGAISAALLRAAQALTTSLDPKDILERLNDVVRSALRCDWSITLLHDTTRNVYRVAGISGTQPEVVDGLRDLEFPQDRLPLFAEVTRLGLVVVENGELQPFPLGMMEHWTASSFLCADLQHAGTSIGVLGAGFAERVGPFSLREIRLFRSIAQQAAIALENARLVESLRAASRLKSEFIGSMSHELRSPLNVVIGYVDLLLDNVMGVVADEQRTALERVRGSALQLLELIQETLDVNRLDAGRLPLDIECFTAQEFIENLQSSVSPYWAKPGVALTWHAEPTPVLLRSDRAKLGKVLRNLIHNALKFTDRGSVAVTVSADDGWVDFTVADTGIGMSPDVLPYIFDMFRQVDGSNTRRHGGVGLGLYIVNQLVRGLGGEISVNSAPGMGSTFHVRLRREHQDAESNQR